jgi:cytochrome c oxidase accessory protein FixG
VKNAGCLSAPDPAADERPGAAAAAGAPREVVISLYAKREPIYPRARIGKHLGAFARWRWSLVWLTQIAYYGTPWLTWRGHQAVLLDLVNRKFSFYDLVLWPQDVVYLTGILIISALSLFLATTVGGRLWCGYACPQTVYTEIFLWVERRFEGERSARIARDRQAMSPQKFARKAGKHGAWIAIALWTGFTFVGYFTPIRELAGEVGQLVLGPWEIFWILFYAFATYGNAGWMREQVCLYMCPYARFQSAMFDRDTLIVTYDEARGEPRGAGTRNMTRAGGGLGDCIDCGFCVQVCPTGIDIRKGLQYECIGCAACIDACNHVMGKCGLPPGLVRYTTTNALAQELTPAQVWRRVLRPRVLVYASILGLICTGLVVSLGLRVPLKVDVIHDRGTLAREVEDGQVENIYRLQIMNTSTAPQTYRLQADGLQGLRVASEPTVDVPATASRTVIVRLRAPAGSATAGSNRIALALAAETDPAIRVHEKTVFFGLRP